MIDRSARTTLVAMGLFMYGCGSSVDPAADRKTIETFSADPAKGDKAEAKRAAERLMAQQPRAHEPADRLFLAAYFDATGDASRAVEQLQFVTDDDPDSKLVAAARLSEGRLHFFRTRKSRSAELALEKAANLDPGSPLALTLLADLYDVQDRIDKRNACYRTLDDRSALDRDLLIKWTCSRRNDAEENDRATTLKAFVAADANDVVSALALADDYVRRGEFDAANAVLDDIRPHSDFENSEGVAVRRATILVQEGEIAAAADILQSLKSEPKRPADALRFHRLMGKIRIHMRQYPAAESALKLAGKIDPLDRESNQLLVQSYRLGHRNAEAEAEPHAARLVLIDRLEDLGQKARATMRRDDQTTHRDIADAAIALGRFDLARAWLRQFLAKDPLNQQIQQEIYKLEQLSESGK